MKINISQKMRAEKYPKKRGLVSQAKKDCKKKVFEYSQEHNVTYSTASLGYAKTMVVIIDTLANPNYMAIEQLNAEIRKQKADFQSKAISLAAAMTHAKRNAERGINAQAWEAMYLKSKAEYETHRCNTKSQIAQRIGAATLEKRKIEMIIESERVYCEEILSIYWNEAKSRCNKLGTCPPELISLLHVANLSITQPEIESDELTDVAEYTRNETQTPPRQLPPLHLMDGGPRLVEVELDEDENTTLEVRDEY